MHLNSECVFPNLGSLFIPEDYWPEIISILAEISKELEKFSNVIQTQIFPNVSIGPHCEHSLDCSFRNNYWNHIPAPSVFDIPNYRTRWKHFQEGRVDVHQLSETDFQSPSHLRGLKCYQRDQPFFDKQATQDLLQDWKYPKSYFDIEAISYPMPRYASSRPYLNLPFQFSCYIQRNKNSELEHHEI